MLINATVLSCNAFKPHAYCILSDFLPLKPIPNAGRVPPSPPDPADDPDVPTPNAPGFLIPPPIRNALRPPIPAPVRGEAGLSFYCI